MIILGIETSCDETAVALVNDKREIIAHELWSQVDEHRIYGGVVPEIASRAHLERMDRLLQDMWDKTGLSLTAVDAIAVTSGPGLIGGLLVGVMAAKTLAMVGNKPLLGINHLEGHALTARLTDDVAFPYLLLLVSGGHCQWLLVRGVGDYVLLGETQDDAVGEAFDKCAKMLGLPYPGGPSVEKAALQGNPDTLDLPMPLCNRPGCDMSFSGLKTALMRHIMQLNHGHQLPESTVADVCASFQATVGRILANRLRHAMAMAREMEPSVAQLVVAGGVAANRYLRTILAAEADKAGWVMVAPPLAYCTDNAAMIAWAGLERFRCGAADSLALTPRARWPLSSAVLLASNG